MTLGEFVGRTLSAILAEREINAVDVWVIHSMLSSKLLQKRGREHDNMTIKTRRSTKEVRVRFSLRM